MVRVHPEEPIVRKKHLFVMNVFFHFSIVDFLYAKDKGVPHKQHDPPAGFRPILWRGFRMDCELPFKPEARLLYKAWLL